MVAQLGEEKALGRPYYNLSVQKGTLQEKWDGLFSWTSSAKTRGSGFKLKG